MNKQNTIIDFKDLLNTYSARIPKKQLEILKLRRWLPIKKNSKLTKEYAYLIGKIMGDGHLKKNFNITFSGQKEEIENLKILISKNYNLKDNKFSIEFKIALGTCYALNVKDSLLGRILFSLGAPKGNKTKQEFLIPDWIHNSKENSKMFLKGLLEDELTTIKIEKSNYSIKPRLKLAKEEKLLPNLRIFLNQVKFLIEKFNVKCSNISPHATCKKGQKTKELYFHINRNKDNIIRFAKNIGFRVTTEKITQLNKCLDILEKTRYNRKPFIDKTRILNLRKQGFSIRQISKIVNLNKNSVHRVLSRNNMRGRGVSQTLIG